MRLSFKKIMATTLVATMTLSLVACGGSDKGSKSKNKKNFINNMKFFYYLVLIFLFRILKYMHFIKMNIL